MDIRFSADMHILPQEELRSLLVWLLTLSPICIHIYI